MWRFIISIVSETSWAYMAGVIDSDGSIGIYLCRRSYACQLNICGDSFLMEWLSNSMPKGSIICTSHTWQWVVFRQSSIAHILSHTIPYMTTKRLEAKLMVECIEHGKPKPYDYYARMLKELKQIRHLANGGERK